MDLFLTLVSVGSSANDGFCANTANIWQIVGYVLLVFKIVIPILLILFGMLDLGKAVVASKSDEVKKAATQLGFRAVAGVAIFLIPTIIGLIMGFVTGFKNVSDDYEVCKKCITSPNGSTCSNAAEALWNGEEED